MVVLLPFEFSFLIIISMHKVAELPGSRKGKVVMTWLPFGILTCSVSMANVLFEQDPRETSALLTDVSSFTTDISRSRTLFSGLMVGIAPVLLFFIFLI